MSRTGGGSGRFLGSHYSRAWFTTLVAVPLLSGSFFSILGRTWAWVPLTALTVVLVVLLWTVPQSVVGADGVRLVLRREFVPWSDVDAFLDPRPGDEEVRVRLTGGRALALPGIPPAALAQVRDLWARRVRGGDR